MSKPYAASKNKDRHASAPPTHHHRPVDREEPTVLHSNQQSRDSYNQPGPSYGDSMVGAGNWLRMDDGLLDDSEHGRRDEEWATNTSRKSTRSIGSRGQEPPAIKEESGSVLSTDFGFGGSMISTDFGYGGSMISTGGSMIASGDIHVISGTRVGLEIIAKQDRGRCPATESTSHQHGD